MYSSHTYQKQENNEYLLHCFNFKQSNQEFKHWSYNFQMWYESQNLTFSCHWIKTIECFRWEWWYTCNKHSRLNFNFCKCERCDALTNSIYHACIIGTKCSTVFLRWTICFNSWSIEVIVWSSVKKVISISLRTII